MYVNFNTFGLGVSGGNRVIFQLANALAEQDYEVTITNVGVPYSGWHPCKVEIKQCSIGLVDRGLRKVGLKSFDVLCKQQEVLERNIPDCDVNVATFWATAAPTWNSQKGCMYYLVQHYEPIFYVEGSALAKQAEATYMLPFKRVCVSNWLAEKVGGVCIGNGVDNTVFQCKNVKRDIDVLVIPRDVYWKGNYLSVIEKLKEDKLNVYVVDGYRTEKCMVDLYNRSRIFLFLSLTEGFGLPPLEAMACGCVVVSTRVCEYLNEENCVFVPFDASGDYVCGVVHKVLGNKEIQSKLTYEGLLTALQLDFELVVKNFETLITNNKRGNILS